MNKTTVCLLICMTCIFSFLACNKYEQADITVFITHPDPSANGKEVIVEIDSYASRHSVYGRGTLENNSVTIEMTVTGKNFEGDNAWASINAYLIGTPEDEDIDIEVYRDIPSAFIRNTQFTERYGNVQSMIYKNIHLQSGGQSFNIEFPVSLNIQIDHENYPPRVSWNQYPDAVYYDMAVLVKDKYDIYQWQHIGNTKWINAYYDYDRITNTFANVYSDAFRFQDGYGSSPSGGFMIAPSVVPGDIFKIEVIAYSTNFAFLDTITILHK